MADSSRVRRVADDAGVAFIPAAQLTSGTLNSDPAGQEYDRLAHIYDKRWRPYIDATLKAVMEVTQFEKSEKVWVRRIAIGS